MSGGIMSIAPSASDPLDQSSIAVLSPRKRPRDEDKPSSEPKAKLLVVPNKSDVTLYALKDRMKQLFPDCDLSIQCLSAPLFACYTLTKESTTKENFSDERVSRREMAIKHVKPVLSFLQALVNVEKTSLGQPSPTPSTVYFSGFDCSSTKPPVDCIGESQDHLEESIAALVKAADQSQALLKSNDVSSLLQITKCLEQLISFLRDMENGVGAQMREVCWQSMGTNYQQSRSKNGADRFKTAAGAFRTDFEVLLSAIRNEPRSESITAKESLSRLVGQAIRYYLRLLFNPEAPRGSELGQEQSQVGALVVMNIPDDVVARDSAVADGSISSLISVALRAIHSYFGVEALLSKDYTILDIPMGFCTSAASQRGPRTRRDVLTENDVTAVLQDIDEAQSFLNAFRACRFILNLLGVPGVREEITRIGGWGSIEAHAKRIRSYKLSLLCPEDAHFTVLEDTRQLFERIAQYRTVMEDSASRCEQSLNDMFIRFKCGKSTSNFRKRRKQTPSLDKICSTLEEGRSFTFPEVESSARNMSSPSPQP